MLLLLTILGICSINGELVGPITIKENGQSVTRYVVSTYAPAVKVSNSTTIVMTWNSQAQIAQSAATSYTPSTFVEYKLKGKTVSYTADLSGVECSCNTGVYLISAPGYGSNGQPNPGQYGDYYCDANDVNKEWCWEMDIMEANKYTMATTPHTCSQAPGGYISSCDRGGCGTNAHNVNSNGMCPSSNCKINTMQPFRTSINFGSTYHVTLTQNGNTFSFDACSNNGYLQEFEQALDYGMALIITYWGGSYSEMQWLDGMTGCKGDCTGAGKSYFSDFEIA